MKKIYLVLIGLLVLFPGAVSAADRTCEYGDDDVTITVIFNENKVTYNFRDKNHNGGLLSDTADFDVNKFNNSCSENIYYTIIETANGFGPNNRKFEFSSEDGSISLNLLASSDGDNAAEHLPCEYEDDKINVNLTIENGKFNTKIVEKDKQQGDYFSAANNKLDINRFKDSCPSAIYYEFSVGFIGTVQKNTYTLYDDLGNSGNRTKLDHKSGNSGSFGDSDLSGDSALGNPYIDGDINLNLNIQQGCGLFSTSIRKWLLQVLDIIKIAGLVLALVLSMFDFLKGAASGEADAMKKVWKSFSKRLITVVLLFLLPVLIEFILGLISINGVDASNPLCGIK